MKTVYEFLKQAGTYYLATVEHTVFGQQARVRPFGTINTFENRLYIQTGKEKNVAAQIYFNPRVELCAMVGGQWLRLEGILVEDDRVEAQEAMLDAYPNLRSMYTTGKNGNTVVYFFQDATATISSFTEPPKVIHF